MTCVELTESASVEIQSILKTQELGEESNLRMTILGGGCSGMKYSLSFDANVDTEEDMQFVEKGVKIVTHKKFFPHFTGTVVDFLDSPTARGFSIENPNFPSGGGCAGCGGH